MLLIVVLSLSGLTLAQRGGYILGGFYDERTVIDGYAYAQAAGVWIWLGVVVPQYVYAYADSRCPNTSVSNTARVFGIPGDEYGTASALSTVMVNGLMRRGLIGYLYWNGAGPPILDVDNIDACFIPGGGGGGGECDPFCIETRPSGGDRCPVDREGSDQGNLCCIPTPILIDVLGNGYDLTDFLGGVDFDFNGDGIVHRISWTSTNSDDAFLVYDRNGNGAIDSGAELFGNITEQPLVPVKNGFLALAEFDRPENGGNSDAVIDGNDAVFDDLRLWQDVNHNGVSEPGELHTSNELGLRSIELDYHESRRRDEHGNWFRFRAKVWDVHGAHFGRWAWDVYLVTSE